MTTNSPTRRNRLTSHKPTAHGAPRARAGRTTRNEEVSIKNSQPKLTIVDPDTIATSEAPDTVPFPGPQNEAETSEVIPRNLELLLERKTRSDYDGSTAFKLYLREIGQTKLLTPLEEVQLAKRIRKGDKKARELMIRANLRLVVKIAHGYEDCGVPLLDLISEGNIGLMKAVERFDPSKGAKLSTYSAFWIKQSIKHALANQSKTIRLPAHVVDKLFRIRRASMELQSLMGREPSDEELAEEVGFSARKVARLRLASIPPVSLEAPRAGGEDNTAPLGETIRDDSSHNPYERLEEKADAEMLRGLVATLLPRELEILRQRFGLDGGPERTLDEVGQKLGVTRERIRQIQNSALTKLRKSIERLETRRVAA